MRSTCNRLVEAMSGIGNLLGWVLFTASWILFAAAFVVPWLGLSPGVIAASVATLLIAAEIIFWVSVILLGKAALARFTRLWGTTKLTVCGRQSPDE